MSTTKVYLVGAGPGDPRLITARGLELLRQADVVVYDYLSSGELLSHARADARLVDVGKKGFEKHLTQDQINGLLVACASEPGVTSVVRLKGGDPFVFGRGGEEALALKAAGVAFEVVPGVTSGIAAPAYAGIPVTHRKVASSVTFVTGHEDPTRAASSIDWAALAALVSAGNTVCFYMGMRNLDTIAERLQAYGAPAATPAALVQWGTTARHQELSATLGTIGERARTAGFAAPVIIVVGQVCALGEQLRWFGQGPLAGRHVLVTRARTQASALSARLADLGARVTEIPTIAIASPESYGPLDETMQRLACYDWLVFTSVNGVDAFFERLDHAGLDVRSLAGSRVAAIGPATARRLAEHGIRADCVPAEYRAEAVFDAMASQGSLGGARVLLARAAVARETLPELLRAAGADVDVVAAYRTVAPGAHQAAELRALLREGAVDAVTFTSSSTARNLVGMLGDDAAELLDGVALCSIGPVTTATLASFGLVAAVQADEYTIEGLVRAMAAQVDGAKPR